jgi:tetratricopeptide (TPR) repeat protein
MSIHEFPLAKGRYTEPMHHPRYLSTAQQTERLRPGPLPSLQYMLASALQHHQRGQLVQAGQTYRQILALDPRHADSLHLLGTLAHQAGRNDIAVELIGRAIALDKTQPAYYSNLGIALQAQGRLDDAELRFRQALALKPDLAEVHVNLGNIFQSQGKLNEAAASHKRALAHKPRLPQAHYNLGNARQAQGHLDAAVACYERALALRPNYAEAHHNMGCVLRALGRLDEALARFGRALEFQPDHAQARFSQALAQLLNGEFNPGWRNYETRWQSPEHTTPARAYSQPQWIGQKLEIGRLLLWGEQGVGDEIMFAGLIPDAIRTGNRILLDCDARLQPLFARSFPEIEVISGHGPGHPTEPGIAAQLPTGNLPGLFRGTEPDFAATTSSYLHADPVQLGHFRDRYADGRRLIGLAWHTKNRQTGNKRSMALDLLAPLFALPGIRWISLQYGDFGELEAHAAAVNAPILIDRSVDQLTNIDLFAAQIAAMDQVITIDNSTAHLAAALGVPVWLLLPFAPDWRWLQARGDSPWYPTMRIFRQPKIGDWAAVLDRVRGALVSTLNCL